MELSGKALFSAFVAHFFWTHNAAASKSFLLPLFPLILCVGDMMVHYELTRDTLSLTHRQTHHRLSCAVHHLSRKPQLRMKTLIKRLIEINVPLSWRD